MPMATIKEANLNDLDSLLEIEYLIFNPPFKREDLIYELTENPFSKTLLLIDNKKIIGFVIYWTTFEQSQIVQIGILPECRKLGYGQLLLEEVIKNSQAEGCEVMTLEVRMSNYQAYNFYLKNNFKEVSIRKNYYSQPSEDARVLLRYLI